MNNQDKVKETNIIIPNQGLLTIRQAATLLQVSTSLLYRLCEGNYGLPVIRVAGLLRFRADSLIKYFESGKFEQEKQAYRAEIARKTNELTEKIKGT